MVSSDGLPCGSVWWSLPHLGHCQSGNAAFKAGSRTSVIRNDSGTEVDSFDAFWNWRTMVGLSFQLHPPLPHSSARTTAQSPLPFSGAREHGWEEGNCFANPSIVPTALSGRRKLERRGDKQNGSAGQEKHKESHPQREREAGNSRLGLHCPTGYLKPQGGDTAAIGKLKRELGTSKILSKLIFASYYFLTSLIFCMYVYVYKWYVHIYV